MQNTSAVVYQRGDVVTVSGKVVDQASCHMFVNMGTSEEQYIRNTRFTSLQAGESFRITATVLADYGTGLLTVEYNEGVLWVGVENVTPQI